MHTRFRPSICPMNDHAFTLVEMVVVTALISIMLVVAIPRLETGLFSDGSDETARWIIANVQHLKEKAVIDQKTYLLNVSPDTRQLWVSAADLPETETAAAREDGYRLPSGMTVDHVAFSSTERVSSGTISIAFYPKGYSDRAIIRMRAGDGERLAFSIEPFLSRIQLVRGSQAW
ncbi:hypothetical protein DSCO28_07220 [Desulfosarcina ovata subsp. sediminis]|uniref:Prepilin-type N-terminal cleavage/methylation domain-containing protein n=1 Tax=Desulfosarcina ovata subsp. sediminis TaxID=885957 RepID=A0A5K7ZGQ2_9BACT|nr:prepilin-type N-terminal cleavage/methylation domain-containing protein [Desulfosarcina ovata]BBO80156.1 hypothetical protein DSCO28_07220 [Desulfosarcina ovata subsp. sediminis]